MSAELSGLILFYLLKGILSLHLPGRTKKNPGYLSDAFNFLLRKVTRLKLGVKVTAILSVLID
jgi:hypothetical protein